MNDTNCNISDTNKVLLAAALLDIENEERAERLRFHPISETSLVVITDCTLQEMDYIFDLYSHTEMKQFIDYTLF